jgi:hypothetical protein
VKQYEITAEGLQRKRQRKHMLSSEGDVELSQHKKIPIRTDIASDMHIRTDELTEVHANKSIGSTTLCAKAHTSSSQSTYQTDVEVLVRVTPGVEYVKIVVYKGKIVGALLIGDTDMEETMEHLILNRLDVSAYGIHLLDPEIDLEDYFD